MTVNAYCFVHLFIKLPPLLFQNKTTVCCKFCQSYGFQYKLLPLSNLHCVMIYCLHYYTKHEFSIDVNITSLNLITYDKKLLPFVLAYPKSELFLYDRINPL